MSAPEQDRLREALRRAADASGTRELDADAVIEASRRSRRRRRNAVLGGTTAVAALVATAGLIGGLAGVVGPSTTADAPVAANGLVPATEGQEMAVAPRDEASHGDVALGRLSAMNQCGAPILAAPGTSEGSDASDASDASVGALTATVRPDAAVTGGSTGEATVTLTNTGTDRIEGSLRMAPAIAIADADGTVVAMRPDADPLRASEPVDLSPGESVELPAAIEAVRCLTARVPTALPPGGYTLAASVVVVPDDPQQPDIVVLSPLAPLTVE
ncbi:hypothetical protein [Agromyces silvae]|uniref:hypothetical protein n=1 Tax=Agromyces silvae TaxID=3388266 RepID=UPI00280A87E1|nr:hypothetical protein [Agromyces protaetiae]